jgi:hypothetical protein
MIHKFKLGDIVRFDIEIAKTMTDFKDWDFVPNKEFCVGKIVDIMKKHKDQPDIEVVWLNIPGITPPGYCYDSEYFHLVTDPDELALCGLSMIGD